MYRLLIRPLLFLLSPETAHEWTFRILGLIQWLGLAGLLGVIWKRPAQQFTPLPLLGLQFSNPLGLAAGFDKDAKLLEVWEQLGFGFVEVGTVTPRPQPGNPRPRVFRLVGDRALINRMGFNNEGVEAMVQRLEAYRNHRPMSTMRIGGNIGKNKDTPNEAAAEDYVLALEALYPLVDYFAVNVSSPNTPGLRQLQDKAPLLNLLLQLRERGSACAAMAGISERPILLKIAPDLSQTELTDVIDAAVQARIHGLIATNTTLSREGLSGNGGEQGGLSGAPLQRSSAEVLQLLAARAGDSLALIGVGGIMSPEDAVARIRSGADLIQIYTGFVYEGPGLVGQILTALNRRVGSPETKASQKLG